MDGIDFSKGQPPNKNSGIDFSKGVTPQQKILDVFEPQEPPAASSLSPTIDFNKGQKPQAVIDFSKPSVPSTLDKISGRVLNVLGAKDNFLDRIGAAEIEGGKQAVRGIQDVIDPEKLIESGTPAKGLLEISSGIGRVLSSPIEAMAKPVGTLAGAKDPQRFAEDIGSLAQVVVPTVKGLKEPLPKELEPPIAAPTVVKKPSRAAEPIPSSIFTPDTPIASTKEIATPGGISDRLYADSMRTSADAKELSNFIKQNPVPAELSKKFGLYEDDPKKYPLAPEEQVLYDKTQKPMYDEVQQIRQQLTKNKYDLDDIIASEDAAELKKGGAIRQVVGKNTPMDRIMKTQEKTPIATRIKEIIAPVIGRKSLSKSAGVLKSRNMFALEQGGQRKIVHVDEDGQVHDATEPDSVLGSVLGGQEVKTPAGTAMLQDATREEITKATGGKIKYHEDARAVTATALLQARRAVRTINTLKELESAPGATDVMSGKFTKQKNIPKDWVEIPGVPALRGRYFDPRFAEEIEDHLGSARRNMGELSTLESLNRFMLSSFFWLNPAHIYNVAEAFAVSKGAIGFAKDLPATTSDFVKASKSVATRDKYYMKGARAGVPYRGLDSATQKFSQDLLAAVTNKVKTDPRGFSAFMKAFAADQHGISTPVDFVKKISQLSHDATFSFQDILQQTLERGLERKGLSQAQATEDIARTLPNYRVPSRLLGSRLLGKAMQGSAWFQFPGWDVGRLTGLGNMLKGAAKMDPKSWDQLLMIAILYEFGKQAVNPALQQLTGNKNAEGPTAGYGVFPKAAEDVYKGDKTLGQVGQSLFPFGYIPKFGSEAAGINTYTGKPISVPGERPAEIAYDRARSLGQDIDPIRRLVEAQQGKGNEQSNIYQQLGAKVPTSKAAAGKVKAKRYNRRELKARRRKEPEFVKHPGSILP